MTKHRVTGITLDAEYQYLVDQLPDVVLIVTDQDMRTVLAGGGALARAGWRPGELLDRRPQDVVPEPVAGQLARHLTAALRGETSDLPALPGTRSELVWEARFAPLSGQDGAVKGVLMLLRDVTRQHRLSEGLRQSEERFRSTVDVLLGAFDVLVDAFGVLSAARDSRGAIVDLRVEYANPAACELFRRRPEDLLGQRLLGMLPSLVPLGVFGKLVHTIETGEPVIHREPWFQEDALTGAFEIRGAKLGDGIAVTLLDVTAKVKAERQLRDSEERYRVTLASAASGFANVGLDGRFLRVNRRFCEITGYSEEELLARRYQDITHPADMDLHVAKAQQVVSGQIPWYSVEKRYLRKDGSAVWVLITVGALRDDEGEVYQYIDTITDITAQKRAQDEVARLNAGLEERVRQRTAELEQANRSLGDANRGLEQANRNLEAFTYTVSHDLRAPLTALMGFSEMLGEECGGGLSSAGREYIGRIEAAGEHMGALIDDLLSLSQASRAGIHATTVDLSELARAAVTGLRHRDPGRKVRASIADGVRVQGDERLLRTVVENLIGNAWKFTAKTPEAAIEFGTVPAGGGVVHGFVRDNGAGFDPADAGKLFRPFTRLHSGADFPGTGVGLASVQRIVERHHGQVWAEGQPGRGASFHFTLPTGSPAAAAGAGGDQVPAA
ncbi:MAG: PAS domain-containing protein [Gemmatimonadota bacterium]